MPFTRRDEQLPLPPCWRAFRLERRLHVATRMDNIAIRSILLQLGADVDAKPEFQLSPFEMSHAVPGEEIPRLLLTWGAKIDPIFFQPWHLHPSKHSSFKALLDTPLGGRRCEAVGLKGRADLNGKKGVALKYLPTKDRYMFQVEWTQEKVLIRPSNLIRRDRTWKEPGIRYDFDPGLADEYPFSSCVALNSKGRMGRVPQLS